jgi:hypothetical protein
MIAVPAVFFFCMQWQDENNFAHCQNLGFHGETRAPKKKIQAEKEKIQCDFVIHSKIAAENRDAVYKRFQEIGNGEIEGVKLLLTWHLLTQDENWSILESSDALQIAKLFHLWTDLALNHLTPVIDNDDMYKVLAKK